MCILKELHVTSWDVAMTHYSFSVFVFWKSPLWRMGNRLGGQLLCDNSHHLIKWFVPRNCSSHIYLFFCFFCLITQVNICEWILVHSPYKKGGGQLVEFSLGFQFLFLQRSLNFWLWNLCTKILHLLSSWQQSLSLLIAVTLLNYFRKLSSC